MTTSILMDQQRRVLRAPSADLDSSPQPGGPSGKKQALEDKTPDGSGLRRMCLIPAPSLSIVRELFCPMCNLEHLSLCF